ncbi:hypothetical protein HMPREF1579_01051 [Gardnerella vaginalis JCP8066]|nr:hypothetical protein HMPREF1579_01051 [Gardnerella vaginalis JCP8066]
MLASLLVVARGLGVSTFARYSARTTWSDVPGFVPFLGQIWYKVRKFFPSLYVI